jgi:uncharacterized surface protein with fasciclin (FAS1) repeats
MKNFLRLMKLPFFTVVLFFGLSGCSDHQTRYEDPPWLGGSNIETLQERGNYTIFLKLMEKANYTEPITKQLFTLFAPDDEAFTKYFQSIGKNSVDDLSKDEAVQLFTLHVLRNPRSRFQLIYEYVWAELQGPKGEYASLYFRKETPSTSIPYTETKRYDPDKGKVYLLRTDHKFIPLFSTDFFEDFFGASDGSDYTFMYRDSQWGNNLNWHSAMVKESEVRTSSGFIYFIDRVVPPMPTIEQYIKDNPKFSVFYDLMQRFATYGNAQTDEKKQVTYLKAYQDPLFNIALERGPSTNGNIPPQNMWTAFLPPDDVLQPYLNNTVLKYYPSIDSVPEVTLMYILQTQLSSSLALISKIEKSFFNSWGDFMTVQRDEISDAYMCSNGVVYTMKKVIEPNVFTCVPGHLFINKDYSSFLYMLSTANALSALANPDQEVTLFAPTNEQLEAYGYRYNLTTSKVEDRGADGLWKGIKTDNLNMFVQDHYYIGKLSDLSGTGYIEMASGNWLRYENNQVFGAENQALGEKLTIDETIVSDRNGLLYKVSDVLKSDRTFGNLIANDPDLSALEHLFIYSELLKPSTDATTKDSLWNITFLSQADRWTGFLPTNAAIAQAKADGIIPAEDGTKDNKAAIKLILQQQFLRKVVIFDDGDPTKSGLFNSNFVDPASLDGNYTQVTVDNQVNNLSITDHSGQVINVDHANADLLVRKGVAHKINAILKY